ncbi:MAG TPA: hypothetical protein PLF16_00185 [Candidatus Staskawiczbacteria bacterium]|nr:hypothetical protein [Candidatus Staskawiczbacteria bacterium]
MDSPILQFFVCINNNYADLILVIAAIASAVVAYREYLLKRRPYVMPEIIFEEADGKWFFYVGLINKGEYPSVAKITKALLKIGDEKYPTIFDFEAVLSPTEKQRITAPIGHINENGRKRILGHEYKSNRVEIFVSLASKGLNQKKFKFLTKAEYEVDISGEKPVFRLIKEEMN